MEAPEIQEQNLVSSYGQFKDFVESTLWHDMFRELMIWVEMVRNIQESSSDMAEMFRCQGRIEAIRFLQILPNNIVAAFEDERQAQEEKENG